ncbi:MAG: hypothetical protein AAGD01_00260 [Acidobacteriota bacterium]
MPATFSLIILVAALVYFLTLVVEAFTKGVSKRWGLELALLAVVLVGLYSLVGFSAAPQRTSFGPGSDLAAVVLMFVCVMLGMAARYAFYRRGAFRWSTFLKPFCISPLVVLPLIGVFPFGYELQVEQTIYFAILAFQNGFFWRVLFERAKDST